MLQSESRPSEVSQLQPTKTAIFAIGGAEDKVHGREILQAFFQRSGGHKAAIAIVPSASREPAIIGERYRHIFGDMGAAQIEIFDIRDRDQASDEQYLKYVEECTGVFLTGGDQLRLCGLLAETPIMERIRERGQTGEIALAGTSAGAAVMGHHMIGGGGSGESPNRSLVDMTMGLGIVPEVVVDQHFHNRNRMARLLSAIAIHPDRLGIGIDEDTCAMFEQDGWFQILGRGTVTVIDAQALSHTNQLDADVGDPLSLHSLRLHVLCHGDRFHLHQRRPLTPMSGEKSA
ncbi:MAG: cyanophycinase [Spirulinaceae cyanobacterium RM2_2_10]|nr:cyanophycinase [Spirulinaceae cyanobacterium SM2_1_0]NJO20737.1 cyanophycinase [Spirulinaceae cyanobacterium RM2_2_10]